jgi:hypothetical protein
MKIGSVRRSGERQMMHSCSGWGGLGGGWVGDDGRRESFVDLLDRGYW